LNFTNQINPLTQNEKIFGFELGYAYSSPKFTGSANFYRTSWKDRVVTSSDVEDDVVLFTTNEGVQQLHIGLELDGVFRVSDPLRIKGFLSVGNWEYVGNSVTRITDEDQNVIDTEIFDVDGGKVGDAAQTTLGLGIDWRIFERLSVDSDYRYYTNLYSNVGAVKENLEVPSYGLIDFGASYNLSVGKKTNSLYFRLNLNNVFDTEYLSELSTNIKAEPGSELYDGIDVRNRGYFGLGRTWNFSIRYRF
jgi:outer membrane receptor for ferrienterochelin and colicin